MRDALLESTKMASLMAELSITSLPSLLSKWISRTTKLNFESYVIHQPYLMFIRSSIELESAKRSVETQRNIFILVSMHINV